MITCGAGVNGKHIVNGFKAVGAIDATGLRASMQRILDTLQRPYTAAERDAYYRAFAALLPSFVEKGYCTSEEMAKYVGPERDEKGEPIPVNPNRERNLSHRYATFITNEAVLNEVYEQRLVKGREVGCVRAYGHRSSMARLGRHQHAPRTPVAALVLALADGGFGLAPTLVLALALVLVSNLRSSRSRRDRGSGGSGVVPLGLLMLGLLLGLLVGW